MEIRERLFRYAVKFVQASIIAFLSLLPEFALSQTPFYEGKTITLSIISEPGGLADMSNRAIVPFLKKYIPGQPDIILHYMPGGGGRKLTNYMYKVARPDGLTIAWAGSALVANFVLGLAGVEYDIDKLIYVGSPNRETHYLFFTRKEAGLNSLEKLRATPGIRIGAQSVGHELYIQARLFAYVLGLKEPRFVTGYSSPELDNALKTGELDSRISTIDRLIETSAEWLEKGLLDFHTVFEVPFGGRDARFAHLPELGRFARSEREKKVLELWRTLRSSGQPYIIPPGTPKERVQILRDAFGKTLRDPEFGNVFKKLTGSDLIPMLPEELDRVIKDRSREPDIIELLKKLAGPGGLPDR